MLVCEQRPRSATSAHSTMAHPQAAPTPRPSPTPASFICRSFSASADVSCLYMSSSLVVRLTTPVAIFKCRSVSIDMALPGRVEAAVPSLPFGGNSSEHMMLLPMTEGSAGGHASRKKTKLHGC